MYEYQIIPLEGVIIQKWSSKVSIKELIESHQTVSNNPLYSKNYNVVFDFRLATIVLTLSEIKELADFIMFHRTSSGRWIALVNRSLETAKLILLKNKISDFIHFSVFSTVEAASNLLSTNLLQYLEDDIPVREDVYL